VQDRDEADFRAQVFRIAGDRAQRLGAGAKKQIVEGLVLVRERGDGLGECEDDVEVLDRAKQLCAPAFEPLRAGKRLALRTAAMATRVVGNALMAAGIALLEL
jgi:hypothetical protein